MDSVFEKFSVYDFFNLLFSGGVFVGSLHLIGFSPLSFLINDLNIPENEILSLSLILLVYYIIGFELQSLSLWIEQHKFKIQSTMTSTFLLDNTNIINNHEKLKAYQTKAKDFFKSRNIEIQNNEFTLDQCEYFFAYCSYFIQINGYSKKAEKLRGLKALSSLWMVCFAFLFLIGLGQIVYSLSQGTSFGKIVIPFFSTILFLILSITCFYRTKANMKSWIRIVLGTYDVCSDLSKDSFNPRNSKEEILSNNS